MYKKIIHLSSIFLVVFISAVIDSFLCERIGFAHSSTAKIYYFSDFIMGVKVEMKLVGEEKEQLQKTADKAFLVMKNLDDRLSNWKEDSEISYLNRNGSKGWIKVSKELYEVISEGVNLSKRTNGAFDMTVGRLLNLWNFYSRNPVKPSDDEINEALKCVNYRLIELNKKKSAVKFLKEGVNIDLGGIAKGYIMKKGFDIIKENGVEGGLINCSGDIYVWGKKPNGSLWAIAIRNPFNPDKPFAVISVTNKAIFTSGDYERMFEWRGKKYHHILNPKTGISANECRGVTVVGNTIDDVNGLSSSLFIMGAEKGKKFVEGMKGIEAVFFTSSNKIIMTKGFEKNFLDQRH
ncbi:MAG: FAD:protein FMN transferase [Candidatus Schekmanbacteria bacterium]|nr:MAG: FAD:protein FMN transferase [Candidatus Schekmanbacteria bacterium]